VAVDLFEGCDRKSVELKWIGTRVDLIFGSDSLFRAGKDGQPATRCSGRRIAAEMKIYLKRTDQIEL